MDASATSFHGPKLSGFEIHYTDESLQPYTHNTYRVQAGIESDEMC